MLCIGGMERCVEPGMRRFGCCCLVVSLRREWYFEFGSIIRDDTVLHFGVVPFGYAKWSLLSHSKFISLIFFSFFFFFARSQAKLQYFDFIFFWYFFRSILFLFRLFLCCGCRRKNRPAIRHGCQIIIKTSKDWMAIIFSWAVLSSHRRSVAAIFFLFEFFFRFNFVLC